MLIFLVPRSMNRGKIYSGMGNWKFREASHCRCQPFSFSIFFILVLRLLSSLFSQNVEYCTVMYPAKCSPGRLPVSKVVIRVSCIIHSLAGAKPRHDVECQLFRSCIFQLHFSLFIFNNRRHHHSYFTLT